MAIIREKIEGDLIRTYSDAGVLIRGGVPEGDYAEAIDPESAGRTYVETDIAIDEEQEAEMVDADEISEITESEEA